MTTAKDVAFQLLILKAVQDLTKPADKAARAAALEAMDRGDRMTVASPLTEADIGDVVRTKPKPVASVTDRAAVEQWCREHYPERLGECRGIPARHLDEALDVLQQHAPHLVHVDHDVVPQDLVTTILAASLAAGTPVGPGGETGVPGVSVERPPGVVTVRLAPGGAEAVRQLFTAGLITVDGATRPRELEGDPR